MKKRISLILLALTLIISMNVFASGIDDNKIITESLNMSRVFTYKGDIYTYSDVSIYKYDKNSNLFKAYSKLNVDEPLLNSIKDDITYISSFDDKIYMLNGAKIYSIDLQDWNSSCTLLDNLKFLETGQNTQESEMNISYNINNFFVSNNIVCVYFQDYSKLEKRGYVTQVLGTGKYEEVVLDLEGRQFSEFFCNNGKEYFFINLSDDDKIKDDTIIKLLSFDGEKYTEEAVIKGLGEIEDDYFVSIVVSSDNSVYVFGRNYIYKLDENKIFKKVALSQFGYNKIYNLSESNVVFIDFQSNSPVIFDLAQMKMPEKVLKVVDFDNSKIIKEYNKLHPECPVVSVYSMNNEGIVNDVRTKANNDVYIAQLTDNLDNLAKHDYILPLDDRAEIMDSINKMYPYVQDAMKENSKTYYAPYNLFSYGGVGINNFAVNMEAWKELGLSEEELPKTYSDLIDIMNRVYTEFGNELEDKNIGIYMNYDFLSSEIRMMALNDIVTESVKTGKTANFNTPEMIQLFEKVGQIKYVDDMTENDKEEYRNSKDTFLFGRAEDIIDIPKNSKRLYLTVSPNGNSYIYADCEVMCINALSENKNEAAQFISFVMNNASNRTKAYLYSDFSDVVVNEKSKYNIENAEKNIALYMNEIEEDKKKNDGKGVKALEEEIQYLKEDIEYYNKNSVIISEEELQELKNNADRIYLPKQKVFASDSEQMSNLYSRFFNKEVSPSEFLSELDRIYNMMQLEQQ